MGLRSQTVTAKLGRDITAAGRTCRTLPYLFVCELIFALSPIHLYYTFVLAAEARDKRHPKIASPQLVIHGSSFRGPVNMGLVTRVSLASQKQVKLAILLLNREDNYVLSHGCII